MGKRLFDDAEDKITDNKNGEIVSHPQTWGAAWRHKSLFERCGLCFMVFLSVDIWTERNVFS